MSAGAHLALVKAYWSAFYALVIWVVGVEWWWPWDWRGRRKHLKLRKRDDDWSG